MGTLEEHAPPDNEPGHHPDHDQDKPDLDAFAEKLGIEPDEGSDDLTNGHGPVDAVKAAATTAREVASTAREKAEPVAQMVQQRVSRAAQMIDDYRHLAERVERLESEVAELGARLDRLDH